MALALAIISVFVGIALGLRFKVLVLVPAIASAIIFVVIAGLARGDGFGSIVLATVIVGVALQLGYLIGIVLAKRIQ
jgi:hypothetical protein